MWTVAMSGPERRSSGVAPVGDGGAFAVVLAISSQVETTFGPCELIVTGWRAASASARSSSSTAVMSLWASPPPQAANKVKTAQLSSVKGMRVRATCNMTNLRFLHPALAGDLKLGEDGGG